MEIRRSGMTSSKNLKLQATIVTIVVTILPKLAPNPVTVDIQLPRTVDSSILYGWVEDASTP
jgi:hypothetical protein